MHPNVNSNAVPLCAYHMATRKSVFMTKHCEAALGTIAANSLSELVNKSIDRYQALMGVSRSEVKKLFTDDQWEKLVDVCADTRQLPADRLRDELARSLAFGGKDVLDIMLTMRPLDLFTAIEVAELEALQRQPPAVHFKPPR